MTKAMTTDQPQTATEAAGGASAVERVVRPCWLRHKWGRWTDTHAVQRLRTTDKALIAEGTQQARRCQNCGKLELRIAWAKE